MALVFISTPKASNANSFCTIAEADAYHDGHLYADDWLTTTAEKEKALVMATRIIDRSYYWEGIPTTAEQALQWPRYGLWKRGRLGTVNSELIPQELKDATAELARVLLGSDRLSDNQTDLQGISSISAGPVSISFNSSKKWSVLPEAVRLMIPREWGWPLGSESTRSLVRV